MLAVVGLPVLLPLAALLQLLFPGLLRDQWRNYRRAVQVLLTQSTLIFVHWALLRYAFNQAPWWLSNEMLWGALVAVAIIGAIRSLAVNRATADQPVAAPVSLEYWALGVMAAVGLLFSAWSVWSGESPWDQMAVITAASLAGVTHLLYRGRRFRPASTARPLMTTELVFISTQVLVGAWLGVYLFQSQANQAAGAVAAEWPTFRGNAARTGSVSPNDPGPSRPQLLWTFEPQESGGRVLIHSSPTVVDGKLFVGAMRELMGTQQGRLYCVSAPDDLTKAATAGEKQIEPGQRIWKFSADGTLQPVFSSPTFSGGRLYVGEGYHRNHDCRLLCLDPSQPDKIVWAMPTTSHVESSPTVAGDHVYVGAGDDGLLCISIADKLSAVTGKPNEPADEATDAPPRPPIAWQLEKLHIDASPTVVGERVFVGTAIGDIYQECFVLACNAETGKILWKIPAPLPIPNAASCDDDRVFFALGSGRLNEKEEADAGGLVWCLNAADGAQQWEFETPAAVGGCPVVMGKTVVVASRDGHCYCLRQSDGKLLWSQEIGQPVVASPAVSAGKIYLVTDSGKVTCLDAATGNSLWQFNDLPAAHGDAIASPTLAGGNLYVAAGGKVYCLGDKKERENSEK